MSGELKVVIRTKRERGFCFPAATVLCKKLHEKVLSGGGACNRPEGYIWSVYSHPIAQGWHVRCDGGMQNAWGTADVWAICTS